MRFLILFLLLNTSLFAQEGVWYKDMDHALANPDSVFQLQLKRKGLSAFPSELSQFTNLQKLDLSKNKIGEFPDSLNHLINLTFLDLSRNKIASIPASISQLIFLEHLDLWHNDVDSLPLAGQLSTPLTCTNPEVSSPCNSYDTIQVGCKRHMTRMWLAFSG